MNTERYVKSGKWITDRLAPINAVMFISTGVLVPVLDFISPRFPFMAVAARIFAAVLVLWLMKLLQVPARLQVPNGFILMAAFCSAVFGAGAFASFKHGQEGGVLASRIQGIAALQQTLLDIRNGKSDNPRVALANMGIPWDFLQFAKAAKRGDAQVVSLFLAGGMPVTENTGEYFESIPYFVVASGTRPTAVLEALAQGGVNLGDPALVPSWGRAKEEVAPNLYAIAKEKHRNDVAEKLTQLGVDSSSYAPWKAAKDEYDKKPKAVFFGI